MSRYRGPRFKKRRRLGALPGLTSKRPRSRTSNPLCKKIAMLASSSFRRETEIAFSLWSDRATITSICAYCWKSL